MYVVYKLKDVVRIPPSLFDLPLEEAAIRVLRESYEGYVDPELGIIVAVLDVKVSEQGRILPGDGATYHDAEFTVLAFKPVLREVVEGVVVNVQKFGAFINIGPVDGFIHVSQVMDEKVEFDPARAAFIGTETRRILERGDVVRARIIAVSMPSELGQRPRVQLTMRQPFLGKIEWIEREVKKLQEARGKAAKG